MPKRQYTTSTEGGFRVRLEARMKNARLVGAREMAGLTPKEAAEKIGVSYSMYLGYESMRMFPTEEKQKKICSFYRDLGIFLFEEDAFPEELRELKPTKKYIAEKEVPIEFLSLSTELDRKLLPYVKGALDEKIEADELSKEIQDVLSTLNYRERQVIKMRLGFDGEKPKTLEEVGKFFEVNRERIRQIEAKALHKLRHPHYLKKLEQFFKD